MIDSGAYVGILDERLPTNRDPRAEGAGQIRAIKTALINSFPNVKGTVEATHEDMNYAFKHKWTVGMIMDFYPVDGSESAPAGWGWCDGKVYNGIVTPDLTDTFIMGWTGDVASIGDTGGRLEVPSTELAGVLESENHVLNARQIPNHKHEFTGDDKLNDWNVNGTKGYFHVVQPDVWDVTAEGGDGRRSPKVLTNKIYDASNNEITSTEGHSHILKGKTGNNVNIAPKYIKLGKIMYVGFPV